MAMKAKKPGRGKAPKEDTPCEENRTSCGISDDQPLPRSSKLKKGTPKESFPAEEDHSLQPGMSKVVTHVTVDDLSPGSMVVGVVSRVLDDEMELDLPFHLSGSVVLEQACEPGVKMGRTDQWTSLKKRFRRGQLVTAVVLRNEGLRIQLTLRPSVVNAGLSLDNITQRMWLPCSIKSFEDFGCSVDFGFQESINAYMTRPKPDQSQQLRQWCFLRPGSIVNVAITEVNLTSRTVTCSMNPTDATLPISSSIDRPLVRAGFLVETKINGIVTSAKSSSVPPLGLTATFCRVFSTTIPGIHSTRTSNCADSSVEKGDILQAKVADKYLARIILHIPSRCLYFSSCLDYLTSWSGPLSSALGYAVLRCRPGVRLPSCRVAAVNPQFAARLSCSYNGIPLMVDVAKSRCLDHNPDKIPLQVGEVVAESRVLASNLFEMAVSGTTSPKMLEELVLVGGDLKPGQLVSGEIAFISESTIFVKLSAYVTGRCPRDHATDVPVPELPPSFEVGRKLKFRVLYVDDRTNDVYLTAKKTLVADENPLVDFSTDAVVGKIVNGVVQKVFSGNPVTLLRFYGGITGRLPTEEFEKFKKQNKFRKGSVVQCQIVEANHLSRSLALSLDLSSKAVQNRSLFAVCSEVMRSLAALRRQKSSAVTPSEAAQWLETSAGKSTAQRVATLKKWGNEKVYVFLPRELRTFTVPGIIIEKMQVIDVTDEFVCVLFVVKNNKGESIDVDDDCDDDDNLDDAPSRRGGLALTIGVVPNAHLADDLKEAEILKTKIRETLKKDNAVDLMKVHPSLFRQAVLLSAYSPIESQQTTSRICLPILSFKASMIGSAENGTFVRSVSDLDGAELSTRSGYVVRVVPSGLFVSMGSLHVKGYVPAKFCSTAIIHDILEAFSPGMNVDCKIISVENRVAVDPSSTVAPCIVDLRGLGQSDSARSTPHMTDSRIVSALELLQSRSETPLPQSISDIEIGQERPAVVRKSGTGGVLVMLSPSVQARISFNELSGYFITPTEAAASFPVGRILTAVKVLAIGSKTLSNGVTAIDVSFRQAGQFILTREDIAKGAILSAIIKAKISSGLILGIEDSDLEAFCYYKNITDEKSNKEEALATMDVGDRVAAKVIETPRVGSRPNVSIKASAFGEELEDITTLQDKLGAEKKKQKQSLTRNFCNDDDGGNTTASREGKTTSSGHHDSEESEEADVDIDSDIEMVSDQKENRENGVKEKDSDDEAEDVAVVVTKKDNKSKKRNAESMRVESESTRKKTRISADEKIETTKARQQNSSKISNKKAVLTLGRLKKNK